jgi:hypothetical protein
VVVEAFGRHEHDLTKEYGSSWIFKLCLTWANALQRVQRSAFSLVARKTSRYGNV